MSEEASDDTGCAMNQGTDSEEKCSQDLSHTDDATPNELFESFMEIANNPELHNEQRDVQKETIGEVIGASNPSVGEAEDINNSANGQRDAVNDQEITNAASDPSISQLTDINSSSDEPQTDMLNVTNDQCATTDTDKESIPNGTPDQGESTTTEFSDSILSQATDINSGTGEQSTCAQTSSNVETLDSTASNAADGQLNSDDNPVQNVTEGPVASCEQVMANPVCNETKPEEQSVTTDSLQSSSDVITNEVHRTEELSCETENLEEGTESSEERTTDNKEISPDSTEVDVDCAVLSEDKEEPLNENDPSKSEADVAKRLSKAMMDLAGLEEQLSSAVTELKRSSSEKSFAENSDAKELHVITEAQEAQTAENQMDGQVASGTTAMDTAETKAQDELVMNKGTTDEESNDVSVQETDGKAAVGETDVDVNAVNVDSSNEESLVEDTDKIEKDTVHVDNVHSNSKGTDVDVVEPQEFEMENSATDNQDIPTNEDSKVENNVVSKSETPDVDVNTGQIVDEKEALCTEESHAETIAKDSNNDVEESHAETIAKDSNNDVEEKSDCLDELDTEVAKSCTSIPDIEITTDESGILENKSLDSLDTEGSSYISEDGIDSDTPSDYGDDDEDGTFDPDNLGASRRKSWLLETDRNRLSSDSSTVSEIDFKESYGKGDNADGKSPKDDYIRGHLLKMGGTGLTPKNWRKRWFVLRRDNCLYYYKQSKDKVPCGVIILANYSVSKAPEVNKNHCLKLTKGGARTYYMCAGSDLDMKKWIMAMTDAIKGSSGSSNPFNLSEGNVHNVSIPALSIRDPDCHGYLYKRGHNIKTWRRRYFVLKNGFLYYYSDMSNTVALGVAKLLDYTIQVGDQTGKKFCFSAVSSEASLRTYFLAAESDMDRTRWLSKLEDSIKKGSLVSC